MIVKILIAVAALSAIVLLGVQILQRRLMYFPDTLRVPPGSVGLSNAEEKTLTTPDGSKVLCWWTPPQPGRPTILYLHGNGGSLVTRAERMRSYTQLGYGMLMMTYRGYGGSTGEPSERVNVADARLAYDTLIATGVPSHQIVIYGESLGSGVAVRVAAERIVAGVVLDAPYTSVVELAQLHYPALGLLTRWLMTDRYESIRHIAKVASPLLIVHGRLDTIIPIEMGRRLHAAATGPKTMIEFPSAGHSDHYLFGSFDAIVAWLDKLTAEPGILQDAKKPRRI